MSFNGGPRVHGTSDRDRGRGSLPSVHAGWSTCPICGRRWQVVPEDDCMMPACGCYGSDWSEANPARPCQSCGLSHVYDHLTREGQMP